MTRGIDFIKILKTLNNHEVNFIIIGGVSAVLHGAPVTTFDLDIIHHRTEQNVDKLLDALHELNAYYRTRRELRVSPNEKTLWVRDITS